MSYNLYSLVWKVNFLSYIEMATKAMPYLEESGGSIIVVSSLLGEDRS